MWQSGRRMRPTCGAVAMICFISGSFSRSENAFILCAISGSSRFSQPQRRGSTPGGRGGRSAGAPPSPVCGEGGDEAPRAARGGLSVPACHFANTDFSRFHSPQIRNEIAASSGHYSLLKCTPSRIPPSAPPWRSSAPL
jgi:hypothetical protein